MIRHHLRKLRLALLLADGLAAAVLLVVVSRWRFGPDWTDAWLVAGAPWWTWATAYGLLWMGAEWLQELDQLRVRWTIRGEILDILRAALIVAVSVFSVLFLVHAPDVSRLLLLVLFIAQVAFSIVVRLLLRGTLAAGRSHQIGTRYVLVLGTNPAAKAVATRMLRQPALGYRVVGYLGRPSRAVPTVLASLDQVEAVIHAHVVDEVMAAFAPDEVAYLEPVISLCKQEGKRLRLVMRPGLAVAGGRSETLDEYEIVTMSNGPDRLLTLAVKRLLDILLGCVALLVLAPVLVVIGIAIRQEDGGPILFRQTRVGLHGRTFPMVKFRSMVPDAEARLAGLMASNAIEGHAFKVDDDPRITRTGRILRRTSLDEIPQFWNVVRGQMSLVGPRPPLPDEVAVYDLWHRRRLSMKPGITGLWQVSARLESEFDRWVELDLRYIDRWSLWLDLKIMLRTLPAMLSGR